MLIEIQNLLNRFLNLPRPFKTTIAISLDFACCVFSVWISYYLRLGDIVSLSERGLNATAFSLIICLPVFSFFGLKFKILSKKNNQLLMLKISKNN